jgi:hypothetical protein
VENSGCELLHDTTRFRLEGLKIITRNPIIGVPAEIQSGHLPSTS